MKGLIFVILISSLTTSPSLMADTSIFKWVDLEGKIHFSDEQSKAQQADSFIGKPLMTTNFVKSASFRARASKNKRHHKQNRGRLSNLKRCQNMVQKIDSLEKKLKQKLPVDKFDLYKSQLAQTKWEKIKYC